MTSPYAAADRTSVAGLGSAYRMPLPGAAAGDGSVERRQDPRGRRRRLTDARSDGRLSEGAAALVDASVAANDEIGPGRERLNPRAVGWAMRFVDRAWLVLSGVGAYWLQPEFHRLPDPLIVLIGLVVATLAFRSARGEQELVREAVRRSRPRFALGAAGRVLAPFGLCLAIVLVLPAADKTAPWALVEWLASWGAATAIGVLGARFAIAGMVARWQREGRLKQTVAIFGTGDLAERLLERLHATCADTIELVGVFDDRRRIANGHVRALVRGTANELIELSRQRMIDRVIVALPHSAEQRLMDVLRKLHRMPVEISLAPDMVGFSVASRDSAEFGGLPLIDVYGRPLSFGQNLAKSLFDKTMAALALIVAAPVMLVCAIAIKLDSRGPVLFSQNRLGFGDRVIRVLKFRTMYVEATDPNGEQQSSRDDPRITRLGRFLRKSSLDELPQLFNVLRGEMSLVGPRPHAVAMRVEHRRNEDIVPDYALRHHVKPGITGWAQVNGHNGPVSTEEALRARVAHDLDYINNWSLWFDVRSLVMTVKIFFRQRHVY